MEVKNSQWITPALQRGDAAPVFYKCFLTAKKVSHAELEITALGVYEAELNGRWVGEFVLAPGWTSYSHRLQVQTYDITALLQEKNNLVVTVGRGWFRSPLAGWIESAEKQERYEQPCGLIAALTIQYADGSNQVIRTDDSWFTMEGPVRFSEIYDGERYDASFVADELEKAALLDWPKDILIPQEGEIIHEAGRICAKSVIHTPAGETVIDFGQEVTGYVEFTVTAQAGDVVHFNHGEVLDRDGNFYNANYRSAKAEVHYICRGGKQTWHPRLTFFGFRYINLLSWPGEVKAESFTALVVHSEMKRTGWLESGDPLLNKLFSNIVWGQRGNFLDIPTDCPQRDERLGWTGDAQVFVKTASFFFDVERFFRKWLRDLAADQTPDGGVGIVIPDVLPDGPPGAAWGDAAVICPWQIYQTYGNKDVLAEQFESMKKWVDYVPSVTKTPDLWTGCQQFGDWLGLDAPYGSYKGSSRDDFVASAFYANSLQLLIKTGTLLGEDMGGYQARYDRTVAAFRRTFPDYRTQTEHVLALQFHLTEDPKETADALARMIREDGTQLRTGFVGTPYLLHVLSDHGYCSLAWDLLLRKEYPGWLYPVTKGATTMWEHWDGIREDGGFWSIDMNSFNHYAYGSVADWVFETAAGLRHSEEAPGYSRLIYEPHPDPRIGSLRAERLTRHGLICAVWTCEGDKVKYELDTPVKTHVCIGQNQMVVKPGSYIFWS